MNAEKEARTQLNEQMKPYLKAATNPKKNVLLAERILAIDDDHLRSHVVGEINAGPDRYALELCAGYAKALSGLALVIPPITIGLGGLLASATAQNDEGHQFIVSMARDAQQSIGFFLIASLVLAFISTALSMMKNADDRNVRVVSMRLAHLHEAQRPKTTHPPRSARSGRRRCQRSILFGKRRSKAGTSNDK